MDLVVTPRSNAGTLTSEQRLIDAISRFGLTLDSSKTKGNLKATFKTLKTLKPPSAQDVIGLTEEINRDGHRIHQKWWPKPYGSRLLRIFEQLQIFTKAGDILVGGSQNMVASGVWAAVRLSLQLAIGQLDFFDQVSSMLMRVGKTISVQSDLIQLFPSCTQLHDFSREYLIVIVRFCSKIVTFASQSFGAKVLSSLTTSFTREFGDLESDLSKWAKLIAQQWQVLMAESLQRTEQKGDDRLTLLRSLQREARKKDAEDKQFQVIQHIRRLCPQQNEFDATWLRERRKGSCKWIFEEPAFLKWKHNPVPGSPNILCISGHLGSGKTVLMANVVSHLKCPNVTEKNGSPHRQPLVAAFFCQYRNKRTAGFEAIVKSLTYQLLRIVQSEGRLNPAKSFNLTATGVHESIPILGDLLATYREIWIVLDAVDECFIKDTEEVFQWLKDLSVHIRLNLCFSARSNAPTRNMATSILLKAPITRVAPPPVEMAPEIIHISMNNAHRISEMSAFITAEIGQRKHLRNLSQPVLTNIQEALVAGAQGMYLWAALQLNAIFPLYGTSILLDADIPELLQQLPSDLHDAINRSLANIDDKRFGSTLFELTAAAARPLKVSELAVALNVVEGVSTWNPSTLVPNTWDYVHLCGGGLLEVDEEEETVHFIHHSILSHLTGTTSQPNLGEGPALNFSLEDAESILALKCITYLSYDCHDKTSVTHRSAKMVDASQMAIQVATSTGAHSRFVDMVLPKKRSRFVDLVRALEESAQKSHSGERVGQFLEYANSYWIQHTIAEPKNLSSLQLMFLELVEGHAPHVYRTWPLETTGRATWRPIQWSIQNGHASIWKTYMSLDPELCCDRIKHSFLMGYNMNLRPDALGNIISYLAEDAPGEKYPGIKHFRLAAMFSWLIDKGANPELPATSGKSNGLQPLQIILTGVLEGTTLVDIALATMEPLLKAGAARCQHTNGESPLLLAISAHSEACVGLLLDHGAEPNGTAQDSITPLGKAINFGDAAIFEVLLKSGASAFLPYSRRPMPDMEPLFAPAGPLHSTSPPQYSLDTISTNTCALLDCVMAERVSWVALILDQPLDDSPENCVLAVLVTMEVLLRSMIGVGVLSLPPTRFGMLQLLTSSFGSHPLFAPFQRSRYGLYGNAEATIRGTLYWEWTRAARDLMNSNQRYGRSKHTWGEFCQQYPVVIPCPERRTSESDFQFLARKGGIEFLAWFRKSYLRNEVLLKPGHPSSWENHPLCVAMGAGQWKEALYILETWRSTIHEPDFLRFVAKQYIRGKFLTQTTLADSGFLLEYITTGISTAVVEKVTELKNRTERYNGYSDMSV